MKLIPLLTISIFIVSSLAGQDTSSMRITRYKVLKNQLNVTNESAKLILIKLGEDKNISLRLLKNIKDSIFDLKKILKLPTNMKPYYIRKVNGSYYFVIESIQELVDSLQLHKIKKSKPFNKAKIDFIQNVQQTQVYISDYDDLNWARKEYLFGRYIKRTAELF